jgi:hypothetical protein
MANTYPCDTEMPTLPIPSVGIFDSPTVNICINSKWAGYVDGALETLLNPCVWDGTDTEVEAAIQEVQKLLVALSNGGGCP